MRTALLAGALAYAACAAPLAAQKRCTKGIPCGNTCIAANKTCRVGSPPAPPATRGERLPLATDRGSASYYRVRTVGAVRMVVIARRAARDRAVYGAAIREYCGYGSPAVCQIMFWTERAMVPERFPMTDAQVNAWVAKYELNRNTGHEDFFFLRRGEREP